VADADRTRSWCRFSVLAALLIASFSLACEGFFIEPVLTGMSVGPGATIQTGTNFQMSAVGTYNDGSQKTLKSNVYWGSDTPTVASVDSSGLVKGIGPGRAAISGACGTVTASTTVTVSLGGLTSIHVTSADGLSSIAYGSGERFVATGTANGEQIDITDSVHWSTNPASISNVSISPTSGVLITTSGPTATVQFMVVALDPSTGISGQMNFSVHP
jgi:Big-like domain-containing protein